MNVRTITTICVIGVLALSMAWAQQGVDFETLGLEMEIAAQEGDFDTAFENADTIIEATPDDVTALSAEEQYWIGHAHMINMGRMMDMAKEDLQEQHRAAFAAGMSDWIIHPHMKTISRGEEVNVEDHLAEGQITIVEFFSPACPNSMQIGPAVEAIAQARQDVSLVKVNINRPEAETIDMDSPVVQQHDLDQVPYFLVYGPDGELQAEGDEAQGMIIGWLEELQQQQQQHQAPQ